MDEKEELKTNGLVERLAEWFGYLFILSVMIIGFEVVARYIFNSPSIWVHETIVMLVGVNFAIGGAVVFYEKTHINITVLYDVVPERVRKILDILIATVALTYLSILTYASWIITSQSWKLGELSGTAWSPPLPIVLKTALFVTACAMAITAVLHLVQAISRLRKVEA